MCVCSIWLVGLLVGLAVCLSVCLPGRPTDRQTDKQPASRQTNQPASQPARQTDRQKDKQTDKQTDRQTASPASKPTSQIEQTHTVPRYPPCLQRNRSCTPCVPGGAGRTSDATIANTTTTCRSFVKRTNAKMKIVYSKYRMFRQARDYFCGTALRPPSRHGAQLRIINARGAFGAEKRTCPLHIEQCLFCCRPFSQPASQTDRHGDRETERQREQDTEKQRDREAER